VRAGSAESRAHRDRRRGGQKLGKRGSLFVGPDCPEQRGVLSKILGQLRKREELGKAEEGKCHWLGKGEKKAFGCLKIFGGNAGK